MRMNAYRCYLNSRERKLSELFLYRMFSFSQIMLSTLLQSRSLLIYLRLGWTISTFYHRHKNIFFSFPMLSKHFNLFISHMKWCIRVGQSFISIALENLSQEQKNSWSLTCILLFCAQTINLNSLLGNSIKRKQKRKS